FIKREAAIQSQLSGIGFLKNAAAQFRSALTNLKNLKDFSTSDITLSDYVVLNGTVNSKAIPGQYSLQVEKLATNHKLASESYATKEMVIGTGSLTFEFGTFSGGGFTANTDKSTKMVDLSGTDGSL